MLWLILLGIFTYFIVQRSVTNITRTPVWLLWLVMMTPALIWTSWVFLRQDNEPIPAWLLLGPFIVCPIVYWYLVQWGRPARSKPPQANAQPADHDNALTPPPPPVPEVIQPILRAVAINKEEENNLKNCFPWSVFYLQDIDTRPQALICRGQLRSSPEVADRTIRENIESQFGDRFLVFFREGPNGKPFFALEPNPYSRSFRQADPADPPFRPTLALGLFLATLFTTTVAGVMLAAAVSAEDEAGRFGLNFAEAMPRSLEDFLRGVPYSFSLMAILGCHELGHYIMARFYQLRATLPYFIPVPPFAFFPFGTFGAFVQLRSPVPNRRSLFDIGIAGPLAGLVVTLPVLLWGLAYSTPVPFNEQTSSLLNFASFDPSASILLLLFSKLALGSALTIENLALQLHPVAIAGCIGLVATAVNLMPVGQLDGGQIVHAMFGQRNAVLIGQVARFLVLALAFIQREFWLLAIWLFLMPNIDQPALNDISELDNRRDFLGLLVLGLMILIVLPAPSFLTQALL
jgi:membrane-associated protease RseP (regulator of RpoE activity)